MTAPCSGDLTPRDLAQRVVDGFAVSSAAHVDIARALLEMHAGVLTWAEEQWSRALLSRIPAQRLLHRLGIGEHPDSIDICADKPNIRRSTP